MTNTIRLVAEDGVTTALVLRPALPVSTDPIFTITHELPMPGPRVVDQQNAGRSGRTDLTQFYDSTVFKAQLFIQDGQDGTTRHQYVDQLRALAAPARRPYLFIQRDGWLAERRAVLRGDSHSVVVDQKSWWRLDASIQFAIPAGYLEDASANPSSATIRPASAQVGRTYPKSYPWSYASANPASAATVTSAGNVPTPPLMRLYGTFTNPTITNRFTGQLLALTASGGVSVAAGNYLQIDVANRTVLLNGDPSLNYYSKLDFTVSSWWEIQPVSVAPSGNTITATATSLDASCELDISWRDRFI